MDKIAVLIPCYNESKTVEKVVSDFRRVLPDATVYVYDNNSTDGTAELAAGAGAVVRHEYQQGKGNVMRRMFREIDAEAYILVDGDDTYPAEAAPEMVAAVTERQADMVVGDRLSSTYYTQNKRPFHNFGNDLVRFFTNHLFGGKIKDIMTGYRAFSYQFVKTYPVLSRGFEIETEMTIHALQRNMQVENVVIDYRDRPEGSESKLNTYSDGFKVLGTIARLFKNYRPFSFFGILAAILAVFGIGFMIPVLGEYFRTGLVPRFPTLIVCCFVLVAALLLAGCGGAKSTRAKADETVHTALFDFTCGQAEVIDSYNGIDIPEGDKLVQFHISVTNTSDSGFLIFKDDFQLQWGDGDSDFGVGFDAVDDDMLSEVTGVSPGSTLEGNILVAVPQDTTTLTVAYQETYEDGSDADAYFVDLSL